LKTHVVRVESGPGGFAPLFVATREAGLRIGWLELDAVVAPPVSLGTAAAHGALRAVALAEGSSLSLKPRRGGAVMKDLVREHFSGCALVLAQSSAWGLRGEEPPLLQAAADGETWEVVVAQNPPLRMTTAELVAALRRPRPWTS